MKSKFLAAVTASALLISPVFAAETAPANAPLPAGKPAGTHQAALLVALGPIFWIGLIAVAVGIGVAVSDNNNTTTTGTGS